MKKTDLLKTFGGISVMLSVFLFLAVALNYELFVEGAKYALETNDDLRQTSIVQSGRAFPPRNIIEGFFDAEREGDIKATEKENGKEVIRHYRAIHVDELKSTNKQPVLKLQVYNENKKSWKVTEISKLDKQDGTVYFLLKSQENEDVVPNDFYTGTYQLIFE